MRKLALIVIFALCAILALTACKPTQPAPEKAVSVSDVTSLAALSDKTGSMYKDTVFTLSADLTVDSYVPIGSSADGAFYGVFDGGGHTLTLNFSEVPESGLVGVFGFIKDATIRNLNINLMLPSTVTINETITKIGGIAAATAGTCLIDKVTVSVRCEAAPGSIKHTREEDKTTYYTCDSEQYVGGLVGSVGGKLSVSNCTINQLLLEAEGDIAEFTVHQNYRTSLFAGGVAAYVGSGASLDVRNTDIVDTNIKAKAGSICIGGFVGSGENLSVTEGCDVLSSYFKTDAKIKGYFGGLAGYAKNAKFSGATAVGSVYFASKSEEYHCNYGGLIGYLDGGISETYDNASVVDACSATFTASNIYDEGMYGTVSYGVGYLKNASLVNCSVGGGVTMTAGQEARRAGNLFGVAYGSAKVNNNTFMGSPSIGVGAIISYETIADDGSVTKTLLPSVE